MSCGPKNYMVLSFAYLEQWQMQHLIKDGGGRGVDVFDSRVGVAGCWSSTVMLMTKGAFRGIFE